MIQPFSPHALQLPEQLCGIEVNSAGLEQSAHIFLSATRLLCHFTIEQPAFSILLVMLRNIASLFHAHPHGCLYSQVTTGLASIRYHTHVTCLCVCNHGLRDPTQNMSTN